MAPIVPASAANLPADAAQLLHGITLISHDCVRIQAADGTVAYIDPFEMPDAPHDGNLIFVTHDHYDHFSPEDIVKAAAPKARIIVPFSLGEQASRLADELALNGVHLLNPGGELTPATLGTKSIAARATHAYNIGKPFHPAENRWLGYVLTVDGVRIFHTGDADRTPDNEHETCDVLLVPVGGTYTMDAEEAVCFTLSVRPRVAVPMHYGTAVGEPGDGPRFARLLQAAQDGCPKPVPAAVIMGAVRR